MSKSISYYTIDTKRLAPYPDMTEDDLLDFEAWIKTEEPDFKQLLFWIGCIIVWLIWIIYQ